LTLNQHDIRLMISSNGFRMICCRWWRWLPIRFRIARMEPLSLCSTVLQTITPAQQWTRNSTACPSSTLIAYVNPRPHMNRHLLCCKFATTRRARTCPCKSMSSDVTSACRCFSAATRSSKALLSRCRREGYVPPTPSPMTPPFSRAVHLLLLFSGVQSAHLRSFLQGGACGQSRWQQDQRGPGVHQAVRIRELSARPLRI
jgi:hypothetical protein